MDALLDQIAASREADEAGQLRVYADQLIQRGDSHGELIVVASARLEQDTPELRRRETALIDEHAARLQAISRAVRSLRWQRGFVDAIELELADSTFDVLAALAAQPAMRLVRRMTWSAMTSSAGSIALGPALAELARLAPRFPRLVELVVREAPGGFPSDRLLELGDVSVLYPEFPGLQVLELRGDRVELGTVALPALRRFTASRLVAADAKRIVAAQLPMLEDLALGFRGAIANLNATFGPLLHRDFGPQLHALAIAMPTPEAQRWIIGELPHCPLARHVTRLGFLSKPLDDECLGRLIADAGHWRRLERLELRERGISASRMNELSWAFGRALALDLS